MTPQDEFAHRLTASLDQGLRLIDPSTELSLASYRRRALAEHHTSHSSHTVLAWAHKHARMGAILALALIIASWWSLQPVAPPYSAETDILLLTGEIPPNAYADNSFSQWLEARATF